MDPDFSFAFNSSNFSDRTLRLEIAAAAPPEPGEDGCATVADWARRRRRLSGRRGDLVFEKVAALLEFDEPDTLDVVESKDHEGEAVAMIEESPSGESHVQIGESLPDFDYTPVVRVNSIFISSAILAAKSPFFYKLFSNGMQESDQRHATIRINASEEAAFMELLGFMYSGKLSQTSPVMLLDVLMAADKFQVSSCMVYCSQMLRNLDMTTESALLFLELPSNVSMPSTVQPLADAAKEFFAEKYKDLSKFQDEVMNLSLAGIEAILSRDDLQVASEDSVYDFVLKWARAQYPNIEERRKILWPLIRRVIRFPYMSCRKLRKLLACNELDYPNTSGVVLGALFYKCEKPHLKRDNDFEEWANRRFTERAYRYRPVKVVEFETPYKQCIVYLNLTREECENLFPSGRIYSQAFNLDGQGFFLSSHCNVDQQNNVKSFGLFLGMQEKGSVSLTVDYEFAARTSPSCEFLSKHSGKYKFTGGKAVGYRNLFSTPWTSFIAEDSIYFINGVLHLRAELTIKESEQQLQQPPVLVEL